MECRVHKLVADVALLAAGQVLLTRYQDISKYDRQRGWFLPDDFIEHLEHPDDAARRILRDQASIADVAPRLAEIESFGNGAWHLVFHYRADLPEPLSATRGANVAAAEWFPLANLPAVDEVAHHGWALEVLGRLTRQV